MGTEVSLAPIFLNQSVHIFCGGTAMKWIILEDKFRLFDCETINQSINSLFSLTTPWDFPKTKGYLAEPPHITKQGYRYQKDHQQGPQCTPQPQQEPAKVRSAPVKTRQAQQAQTPGAQVQHHQ